jgi:hypothetical protein
MFQSWSVEPVMKKHYCNAHCMHQLPFDCSEIQCGMWHCHCLECSAVWPSWTNCFHCVCLSLTSVWGNTALKYLCCVTCSRYNIHMYISFMLHFLLLVVVGSRVTIMQLGFCGRKWMIYSVSAVIKVSFRKVKFFEQFEAFKPVWVKLFVHLYSL